MKNDTVRETAEYLTPTPPSRKRPPYLNRRRRNRLSNEAIITTYTARKRTTVKLLHSIGNTILIIRRTLKRPRLSLRIRVIKGLRLLNLQRVPAIPRCVSEGGKRSGSSFDAVGLDDEGAVCGWFVDGVG